MKNLALYNRAGMIEGRFVKISFTAERNSKTPPMVRIEIVCGDDPVITRKAILEGWRQE